MASVCSVRVPLFGSKENYMYGFLCMVLLHSALIDAGSNTHQRTHILIIWANVLFRSTELLVKFSFVQQMTFYSNQNAKLGFGPHKLV